MKTHKDLQVWNEAIQLTTDVYQLTQKFPREEIYGLTSQIRRSVVSIPSNIAEGATRDSNKEFIHFLSIALGSSSELETQLIIAKNINYITTNELNSEMEKLNKIRKMVIGLKRSIK